MSDRSSDQAIQDATREIYDVNRNTIGNDPDLIHPGQTLQLPRDCQK